MTRDNIKYYLMLGSLKAIAWLPLGVLYALSDCICFFLKHILKYRRKVINENLKACFPEKTEDEIDDIRNDFYLHLSDVIVETVKLLNISDKTLDKRIEVVNYQLIDDISKENKSIILFLAHYCNWEWVPDVSRFYTSEMKSYHVYKMLRDHVSDRLFLRIRSRFHSIGIEQHKVVKEVLGMARDKEKFMIGFISDHRPNVKEAPFHVFFLNHNTPVNDVGEALGKRCGMRFVYLDLSKPRRGHYRMEFKELAPEHPEEKMAYTKEYFKMLEKSIRRQPPYWLWSHRRWLYH